MKDQKIQKLIKAEEKRQKTVRLLIASENIVSADVRKAVGSVLMNKYAEGYPGKRYYSGQINVDKIEVLAQKRALKLFKLSSQKWGVNVQPLSGPRRISRCIQRLSPWEARSWDSDLETVDT